MKTNPNEPANPFFTTNQQGYGDCVVLDNADGVKNFIPYTTGLTKREYFAAMAMQGYLSNPGCFLTPQRISEHAVESADALINELNK